MEKHKEVLDQLFRRLQEAGLQLKPSKCDYFRKEIIFLGHHLSEEGIRADPALLDKIQNFPVPLTVKNIRSFLGLCQYFHCHIKSFSLIAKPLYELTSAYTTPFNELPPKAMAAFEKLKELMVSPPVLAYPNFKKPFYIETDSSKHGLGAVLLQKDDNGKVHPMLLQADVSTSTNPTTESPR